MRDFTAFMLFCCVAIISIATCSAVKDVPPKESEVIDYGYNYNVVKLNDTTFMLNPTSHNREGRVRLIVKDSLQFYMK